MLRSLFTRASKTLAHPAASCLPRSTTLLRTSTTTLPRTTTHHQQQRGFQLRTLDDVKKAGNVVVGKTGTWESRRYYLRKDGFGYSMHQTILRKGQSTLIHYRNHVELVFITHGQGEIEILEDGQSEGEGTVHQLAPGSCYALDKHDRHILRAFDDEDLQVVCTFTPPIDGAEDHNEDGVYPVIGEDGIPRY